MASLHWWEQKIPRKICFRWKKYLWQLLRLGLIFWCSLLLTVNPTIATSLTLGLGASSVTSATQTTNLLPDKAPDPSGWIMPSLPRLSVVKITDLAADQAKNLAKNPVKNERKNPSNAAVYYQEGRYQEAITIWQANLENASTPYDKIPLHRNLAIAYRQIGQISQAIAQWQAALELLPQLPDGKQPTDFDKPRQEAAMLTEQGQLYGEMGQNQSAISILERALEITQKPEYATQSEYLLIAVAAQGSLGNAYAALGSLDKAQIHLESALAKSKQLEAQNHPQGKLHRINTQNNLGNLLSKRSFRLSLQVKNARDEGDTALATELLQKSEQDSQAALALYEDNVNISAAVGGLVEVQALLNYSRVLFSNSRPSSDVVAQAHRYQTKIEQILTSLPPSRDKVYSLIALTENINLWHSSSASDHSQHLHQTSINILESAVNIAQQIGDTRGESFAWGSLGWIAKNEGKYDLALEQTRRAMLLSQAAAAPDSLYRWQWQLGRILRAQQQYPAAISAYEQAIASLQTIRADIIAANKEVQFNFRDSVEVVYRELIDLLLMPPSGSKSGRKMQSGNKLASSTENLELTTEGIPLNNIRKTLDILELLKLAELQNFFGDDCVQVESDRFENGNKLNLAKVNLANDKKLGIKSSGKSALKEDTVVIYNILLENRTEIILRSRKDVAGDDNPKDTLSLYHVPMGMEAMQKEVNQLRGFLEKRSTDEYLPQVQRLYQLLIEPMAKDLAVIKPKTLVFVNDGVLRKIPMAALNDGKEFLIQKYAVANTPSLSLTSTKGLDRDHLQALMLGLTVEIAPFAPLPNVKSEIDTVAKIVKGTKLLDKEFTIGELDKILRNESYPIIHMATHGRFGVDAETTFLQTYDGRMGIDQLDTLLRSRRGQQAVDLLTLSACQTAVGDDRSALGIAGVAVRAGVRSALASLWFINDQATVPLIQAFYEHLLQDNLSKAHKKRKSK